jgi:glutamine cyclotransferase
MTLRTLIAALALVFVAAVPAVTQAVPLYGYQVVHAYPHDPKAFTEGLFFLNGYLFESTGLEGRSSVRKEKLETGQVVERHDLAPAYFGEGIVEWKDKLVQLTYRSEKGFVYDLGSFKQQKTFGYHGEGWGLTHDDHRIIMSDGTPQIRFIDPTTLKETGRITVTDNGRPVANLNELEWVKGEIFANIWQTEMIARINPKTGKVVGWIDLSGLRDQAGGIDNPDAVLNGIAYDSAKGRLLVTGKLWPKLFEIKLVKKSAPAKPIGDPFR